MTKTVQLDMRARAHHFRSNGSTFLNAIAYHGPQARAQVTQSATSLKPAMMLGTLHPAEESPRQKALNNLHMGVVQMAFCLSLLQPVVGTSRCSAMPGLEDSSTSGSAMPATSSRQVEVKVSARRDADLESLGPAPTLFLTAKPLDPKVSTYPFASQKVGAQHILSPSHQFSRVLWRKQVDEAESLHVTACAEGRGSLRSQLPLGGDRSRGQGPAGARRAARPALARPRGGRRGRQR